MKQGSLSVSLLLQRLPQRHRKLAIPDDFNVGKSDFELYPELKASGELMRPETTPTTSEDYYKHPYGFLYYIKNNKLPQTQVKENETLSEAAKRLLKELDITQYWIVGRKPIANIEDNYIMKVYSLAVQKGEWVLKDELNLNDSVNTILSY